MEYITMKEDGDLPNEVIVKETSSDEMNGVDNAGYESLDNDVKSSVDEDVTLMVPNVKIYKRRWYMMILFSLFSLIQCAVWNTWGPVSHSAMALLHWKEHDIAMMANYGCIMSVVFMGLFMWLMVEKGLRWSMVLASGLSALGTLVRCISLEQPLATPLMHLGAALNGVAGPFAQGACTLMSVTWFPPHERITATSIANAANYLGAGVSFLIGPVIVSDEGLPDPSRIVNSDNATVMPPEELVEIKEQIELMLITYAVLANSVFVASLIYFPAKPPIPPSATAACSQRSDDFFSDVRKLFRNREYWQLAMVYAVTLGIYGAWTSVIDVNLMPIGVRQSDAAWLGFYSILGGAVFTFISARFNDMFSRHVKKCLVVLFIIAAALFGWFSAIAQGLVPLSLVELYIAGIMGSSVICGTIPLLFEVGCELAFPVSEAIASGMEILMFNLVGTIFLSSFFIPNIGLSWMNWLLFASTVVAIPLVASYKEIYVRLELDEPTERQRTESMNGSVSR